MSLRQIAALMATGAIASGVIFLWYRDADPAPSAASDDVGHRAAQSLKETESSLTGVFALADDWERNAALYALLSGTDRAQVETLIAAARALEPPVPHRYDIVRVLYMRYASLSPEAAVDHVLASDAKPSWIGVVFGAWAERNLDSALARALALGPLAKDVAARAILALELTPQQRLEAVRRLGMETALAELALWEHRRRPGEPPAVAWHRATSLQEGPQRGEIMLQAALTWAAEDLPSAWEAVEGHFAGLPIRDRESAIVDVMREVLKVWAADDPAGPARWLRDAVFHRGMNATPYAPASSKVDYMLGVAMMRPLARSNPRAAWEIAQAMPVSIRKDVFRNLAETDTDAALELFGSMDRTHQTVFAPNLAAALMDKNPVFGVRWWAALDGRLRERTAGHLRAAHREAPGLVERLVGGIDDAAAQHRAAEEVLGWVADPEADWRWVSTLGTVPPEKSALRTVFLRWHARDPDAAIRAVSSLADHRVRDYLLAEVADQ
ncbi:MAG: hypothetical protein OXQ90_05265 [Gammaproteobacteria bacterium]|nr:hypothetical protein [Gammaproteobacteria bacterium]